MFKLTSNYKPTGDQPQAILQLCEGIEQGELTQCLLGVTGSGKTFTMANVIAQMNRPTLILTHNKTLTAQLYSEFRQFFPDNAVEYFVSYYDFYQPEAYMPMTDTYIEKDMLINDEIDKLRLRATASILSGRRDIIVVASVSCIYGMGNPTDYKSGIVHLRIGQTITRNTFLYKLVESLYSRTELTPTRGQFRVTGDTVDIFPAYADSGYRVVFFGDEIESLYGFDPESGRKTDTLEAIAIFPANLYIPPKGKIHDIISNIQDELFEQVNYFKREGKEIEASRIQERTDFDLEMIKELGYCSGVENYSRFFDGREAGTRPFCLLDYFPSDFLLFIDESHATIPQLRGMWGGDRARKQMLIGYGFRLPSAMDNRPLRFDEFEEIIQQHIYVSATPSDYELEKTGGVIVEQLVRPTGLLDPPIVVRPSLNQIDDLLEEIRKRIELNERVLVTTLTKRMTEELTKYLQKLSIKVRYIHSEVDTMERTEILRDLQLGEFDVLVGVNLLREGLDLPEVSLVAILDADKEGFLRNQRSLTQTAGRAARNVNGLVIFYADKITDSMRRTMDETNRRRSIQMQHNDNHGITPRTVTRSREEIIAQSSILDIRGRKYDAEEVTAHAIAAETEVAYTSKADLKKQLSAVEKKMREAAKTLDFILAAQWRDESLRLKKQLESF
ncbi:MAG: hypothetical protein RL329_2481 [Bacteroidota bacterium]